MGAEGGIAKLCRAAIEDCCRQPAPVDVAERSQQAAFAQLVVLEKISATFQKLSFGFLSSVVKLHWVKNQKAITTKKKLITNLLI